MIPYLEVEAFFFSKFRICTPQTVFGAHSISGSVWVRSGFGLGSSSGFEITDVADFSSLVSVININVAQSSLKMDSQ